MTHEELVKRGKTILLVSLVVFIALDVVNDLWLGTLYLSYTKSAMRFVLTIGLAVATLRGRTWARKTLAFLLFASVFFSGYAMLRLGTLLPVLSAWMGTKALIYGAIAAVLTYSSSIAIYESSKNELLMP